MQAPSFKAKTERGFKMLMRWSMLLDIFVEILACYCAMLLGRRVKKSDELHRVYVWRGREYLI